MDMSRDEVMEMLDGDRGAMLIDVRPREGFNGGHIPGAHGVPLEDDGFEAGIDGLSNGDHSLPIVVFASGPASSEAREAAERLVRAGFADVRTYPGGMEDWQSAALPVQSGMSAG